MLYGTGEASVWARKNGMRAAVSTPRPVTGDAAPAERSGRVSASNR
jgi:hypothetical protein